MKTLNTLVILIIAFTLSFEALANSKAKSVPSQNILVVGFAQNFNSNYLPRVMIADKLGVEEDKFDLFLHSILINGFKKTNGNLLNFHVIESLNETSQARKQFPFRVDNVSSCLELSTMDNASYRSMLSKYGADYVLVFSQYYIKSQEEHQNTLFHLFDYSVLDCNMNEIAKGQEYFSTFNNFKASDIERQFDKLIRRYANQISRSIK